MSSLWLSGAPLVLASRSAARLSMMLQAGIAIDAYPASIDERALQEHEGAELQAPDLASLLAKAKALSVSREFPGRLVLGSDQTLEHHGNIHSKARTREEGARRLRELSGSTHLLHSAYCFVRDGAVRADGVSTAKLTMRRLSDEFIERYLDACGADVLQSVGVYQIEGLGIQLFEEISGDWFTILGMPLISVIAYLRSEKSLIS